MLQTPAIRSGIPARISTQRDIILLDCSSSMISQWTDICKAIDAYVQCLQWDKINTSIYVVGFSSGGMDVCYRDCHVNDWQPLVVDHIPQIQPTGGMTPLYDGIQLACWRLRDEAPSKAHLTIATDGDENDSKFTDLDQPSGFLNWARAQGYQVTFLGCDFNNEKLGASLGANPGNTVSVQKALLEEAAKSLAKKRTRYSQFGTSMEFDDDERSHFGGMLTDQTGSREDQ